MDRPKKEKRSQKQVYILRSKSSPLSFEEHLVYSCLVYRARYKAPATKTEIARLSKLKRGTTVKKAIDRLESLGLVKFIEGKWIGLEPNQEQRNWFIWQKREPIEWTQDFAYVMCLELLPEFSRVLSPRENVLVWILYDGKWRGKNKCFLSRMLGSDPKTLRRLMKSLMEKKIIGANRKLITKRYWIIPKGKTPASVPPEPVPLPAELVPIICEPQSTAERVKAEGQRIAKKMEADIKAQAEQVEKELIANYLGNPKDLERMGFVESKSPPQVEARIENKPAQKSYNGWETPDGMDMTPEEEEAAYVAMWEDSVKRIAERLEKDYGLRPEQSASLIKVAESFGDDARYQWTTMLGILEIAPDVWKTSNRFASGNVKGHFLKSMNNRIRRISEECIKNNCMRYVQLREWVDTYSPNKKVSV